MDECLRTKVARIRGSLTGSSSDSLLYQELSDLLFQAGKISAGVNILEKSFHLSQLNEMPIGTSPQDGKVLFNRGLEYADAYLYEDAVECLLLAVAHDLDTFETHYCLAGVYKSLENFAEAEKHCRLSLEQNCDFAPGYILLGTLLKNPLRLEESVSACKKALLIDPDCKAAYYDLACYYSLLAKTEQAMAAIEMALCKGFCDFDWMLQDPDLSTLRHNPEFEFLLQSYRQKNS